MIAYKNVEVLSSKEFETFSSEANRINNDYLLSCYKIVIEISNRLKRAAGNISAKGTTVHINISHDYYKQFGFERIIGTLRHEFAHLITYDKTGRMGHDYKFKQICSKLGGTMSTTMAGTVFSESASGEYIRGIIKNYKYEYTCKCGAKMTYKKRMTKKVRTNPWWVCIKCKTSVSMWKEEKIFLN